MSIPSPDLAAAEQARARQTQLTKPAGALGRLEAASVWMSAVQGQCPPHPFTRPAVVIFAGDHGVARMAGTSAYPSEVTAQMVLNFLSGGAAVNVLARQMGASVTVVDISVDCDPSYVSDVDVRVAARRVRRGSGAIDREDAMTIEECQRALRLGADLADEAIDAGADVLIPGDMGIGNTTPAAALIACVLEVDAAAVTGRGTGIDDHAFTRKRTAVTEAVARGRLIDLSRPQAIPALLACLASPDIAAMVGFMLQASRRGVPVVLDGVVSCAAALAADRVDGAARSWWAAGHRSTEPAASAALEALALRPLVDLDLRLGEGTGALLALPLLTAAARTLAEMATFDSAGVSDRPDAPDASGTS